MTSRQAEVWETYQAQGGHAKFGSVARTAELTGLSESGVRNALKRAKKWKGTKHLSAQDGTLNVTEVLYREMIRGVYAEMTSLPTGWRARRVA